MASESLLVTGEGLVPVTCLDGEVLFVTPDVVECLDLWRQMDAGKQAKMRRIITSMLDGTFPHTPDQVLSMSDQELAAAVEALP